MFPVIVSAHTGNSATAVQSTKHHLTLCSGYQIHFCNATAEMFLKCFQEKTNNETDGQNYVNQSSCFEVTKCASFWEFPSGVIFVLLFFFFTSLFYVTHKECVPVHMRPSRANK